MGGHNDAASRENGQIHASVIRELWQMGLAWRVPQNDEAGARGPHLSLG